MKEPIGTIARKCGKIALFAVVVMVIILLCAAAYEGALEKTAQLSAYSSRWNDLSRFKESLEEHGWKTTSIVSSPTMLNELEDPRRTLLVVIGVEKKYSYTEAAAIKSFIERGGKAIIADDFGYANSLADDFFHVSFYGARLWDDRYEKNPSFVKIDVNTDYFSGVILLNEPTAFKSVRGMVVAESSENSWVDLNNNLRRDPEEEFAPYPVILETQVDEGVVVFISDPSMFINDMWGRANNSAFVHALVEHLLPSTGVAGERVAVFEESRHLQDSVFENTQQAVFETLVKLTTDDALRILTISVTLLLIGIMLIYVDNPRELRHRQDLSDFKLVNLRVPYLTPKDTEHIRYLLLEKVRIACGLAKEEFRELSSDELTYMIKDPELIEFALNWRRRYEAYSSQDLERILYKIDRWSKEGSSL
jgi:hypothetical protein